MSASSPEASPTPRARRPRRRAPSCRGAPRSSAARPPASALERCVLRCSGDGHGVTSYPIGGLYSRYRLKRAGLRARAVAVRPDAGVDRAGWTSTLRSGRSEFLCVDTETNGLGGEACELTEWAPCSSAAASCTSAGRRCYGSSAALAGDPGVHGYQPGDGRRVPRRRRHRCPSSRSCSRDACSSRTVPRSIAACSHRRSSGPSCRGPIRPRSARSRWRGGCTRWPASAGSRCSRARSGSRSRRCTERSPTPRPAHASSARCSPGLRRTRRRSPTRWRCSRRRGPRDGAPAATDGGGARAAAAAPSRPARGLRLARRLRRAQRGRSGALRRQVDARAHARAGPLRAVVAFRWLDRLRRDGRAPPDGIRAGRAGARAAARRRAAPARQREASRRSTTGSGCAVAWTSPSRCSRWRASPQPGTPST